MLRNSWVLVNNVLPRVSEMVFKGSSVPDLTKLGHLRKKKGKSNLTILSMFAYLMSGPEVHVAVYIRKVPNYLRSQDSHSRATFKFPLFH